MVIDKARRISDRVRIERLVAQQESSIRNAFKAFLREARSERTMREVRRALEAGNIAEALATVEAHITAFGGTIPQAITRVGTSEVAAIGARIVNIPRIAITFDPSEPRVAALMRANRLEFVREFTTRQREATRAALAAAYQRGSGTREAARAFRGSIGLTRRQVAAVENYRGLLERVGQGDIEALTRDIRDRRFDSTVRGAAERGEPLSAAQIDRMVERYRERYLDYRAENIARTEGLRLTSIARHEALEQVVEQAGFERGDATRTWNSTRDERVRDSHAEMDGQQVGLDEPFISGDGNELMFPGDPSAPAEDTINCRCAVTVSFLPRDEAV